MGFPIKPEIDVFIITKLFEFNEMWQIKIISAVTADLVKHLKINFTNADLLFNKKG